MSCEGDLADVRHNADLYLYLYVVNQESSYRFDP